MIVGFTGTRWGMTNEQRYAVAELLARFERRDGYPDTVGLHGDCVGADADFHELCVDLAWLTECRPCTLNHLRAHTNARQIAKPVAPLVRNRAIAQQCDVLIACPPNITELKKGSGTWATIRYGVKAGKRVHVVFPDGSVEVRGQRA